MRDGFNVEHDQGNGRHKFGVGSSATRDAIGDVVTGSIWFNTDDVRHRLQTFIGATWVNAGEEFTVGTIIVAHGNAAPVGWMRVLGEHEGRALIWGGESEAMSAGGSWTISGMVAVNDAHVHSIIGVTGGENQNHVHSVSGVTGAKSGGTSQGTSASGGASTPLDDHTHLFATTTGLESNGHDHNIAFNSGAPNVSHAHAFDGSWRPEYITVTAILKAY